MSKAAGTVTRAMCLLCYCVTVFSVLVPGTICCRNTRPEHSSISGRVGTRIQKKSKKIVLASIMGTFWTVLITHEAQSSSFCRVKTSLRCPHSPRRWGSFYLPQPSTRRRSQCFGLAEISCDLCFFPMWAVSCCSGVLV